MSWTLHDEKPHAEGVHRSGWPYIHKALQKYSTPGAKLRLLDFADMQLRHKKVAITDPWVGIFHYPAEINSPIPEHDKHNLCSHLFKMRHVQMSLNKLKAVIVLAPMLQEKLRTILPLRIPIATMMHPTELAVTQWVQPQVKPQDVPVHLLMYPTELDVPKWEFNNSHDTLLQVGFFLRDTRAIFKVLPHKGWQRARFTPTKWALQRELKLPTNIEFSPDEVIEIPRLSNDDFDRALATCGAVLTWVHGAEANNVVVECIARATPLAINYHPSVAFYLGEEYPLYLRNQKHLAELLPIPRLVQRDAHEYLLKRREMNRKHLSIEVFAERINAIMELV